MGVTYARVATACVNSEDRNDVSFLIHTGVCGRRGGGCGIKNQVFIGLQMVWKGWTNRLELELPETIPPPRITLFLM